MSIREYLKEENKEIIKYEYTTKNETNFFELINEIILKIKEYKISKINLKIEIEGIKTDVIQDDFP